MRYIDDQPIEKKTVLLRVDYNVSLHPNHTIADDLRIRETIPTIEYLLKGHNKIILLSHMGRPHGPTPSLSLEPVAKRLEKLLGRDVLFCKDLSDLPEKNPSIILFENLRFNDGEDKNSLSFAKEIASHGDTYVNDAFGVSHRKCASITQLPTLLPSYGGLLLKKEIRAIDAILKDPKKPFVSIIGGAKMEGKIPLLRSLIKKSDFLLLGGGIANTFLKALNEDVGRSLLDLKSVPEASSLLRLAEKERTKILVPSDCITGDKDGGNSKIKNVSSLSSHDRILDIGPQTQAEFAQVILGARTILWNGPMGLHEMPEYARGTDFVYYAILTNKEAKSLVGGGDTITAIKNDSHLEMITHISTGGGALLSYIENGTLPGIEALN